MKAINLKITPPSEGNVPVAVGGNEPYYPTVYLGSLPKGTKLEVGQEVTLRGVVKGYGERDDKKEGSTCNADIEVREMTPCCKTEKKDARAEDEEAVDKGLDEAMDDEEGDEEDGE